MRAAARHRQQRAHPAGRPGGVRPLGHSCDRPGKEMRGDMLKQTATAPRGWAHPEGCSARPLNCPPASNLLLRADPACHRCPACCPGAAALHVQSVGHRCNHRHSSASVPSQLKPACRRTAVSRKRQTAPPTAASLRALLVLLLPPPPAAHLSCDLGTTRTPSLSRVPCFYLHVMAIRAVQEG